MIAATDRLEFAPPPAPGIFRAFALAVLAHLVLLAALTWGVHWTSQSRPLAAEAELWSAVPQQAAPKLVEVPVPEPLPAPIEPVKPAPPPPPPPPVAPPEVQPQVPDPAIALEQEKLRLKKEQDKLLELEKQRAEKQRLEKLKQEKLLREKMAAQEKAKAEQEKAKAEQAKKKAELEKKKAEAEKQRLNAIKAKEEEKQLEAQRKTNLERMAGLAGATGSATSTGTAKQSSGPSANYASRIRARVKPNIVFLDDVTGNPTAEVEVRTSPDGTIVSRKLLKPSGVGSWDEAVLKAIDKTEVLPRDTDGRVPSALIISFRPKD